MWRRRKLHRVRRSWTAGARATLVAAFLVPASLSAVAFPADRALASPGDARAPFVLQLGSGLFEQYGYAPDYTRHVPAFDADGHAYIRSRTANGAFSSYVHTLQDGEWVRLGFQAALRDAYPGFTGTVGAAGQRSDRIVFDRQDRAYNPLTIRLADGSTRNVLMVSWDRCRTWKVYQLPAGDFAVEHWVGHNEIDGPPFLAYWRPYKPAVAHRGRRFSLWVTKPRLEGEKLVLPTPALVTRECLGLNKDSGGASFAVTHGSTTHFVWSEASKIGTKLTPQLVAAYDHETGTVGPPLRLTGTRPANDQHNKPGICLDGQGYLHVVAGTHGTPVLYLRSLEPYTMDAGWTPEEAVVADGYAAYEGATTSAPARQTYNAFVCDSAGTLHLITRQWRRGLDAYHEGAAYGALVHQSRPAGGEWGPPTVVVVSAEAGYGVYFHKVALDAQDRLFLSCSYSGGVELLQHKVRSTAMAVLGRTEPQLGKYRRRMLLVSDGGGAQWRFAGDADLAAPGEPLPRAARGAPPVARTAGEEPLPTLWSWLRPQPQGNQLAGLDFADRRVGWAVGTHGTILRSRDGGATWRIQDPGTKLDLYGVAAVDRRNVWVVGESGLVLRTRDGGLTWKQQPSPLDHTLFAISARSGRVAWAVGHRGAVQVTTDAGRTWRRQYSKTKEPLFAVSFVDGRTGWASGGNGRIVATTNGGRTWVAQRSMVGGALYGISFFDRRRGMAVGTGGTLLRTRDGGRTWRRSQTSLAGSLRAARMVSPTVAYASGGGGLFLRSRDGGRTWSKRQLPLRAMSGALAADARGRVWAGGVGGAVTRSTDGGRRWSAVGALRTASLRAVTSAGGQVWVAGSGGLLSRSPDGGVTWRRVPLGTAARITGLGRAGSDAWLVGASGTVVRSGDGGRSWELLPAPSSSDLGAVAALGDGRAWVAGDGGGLFGTVDGGRTWAAHPDVVEDLACVTFFDALRGWAGGGAPYGEDHAILLRTTDGGATWHDVRLPVWGRLLDVQFLTPTAGWAVAEDWGRDGDARGGAVLATTDGGLTWAIQAATASVLTRVSMSDPLNGWVFGEGGGALQTWDGGATWTPRDAGTDSSLHAVTLDGGARALVVGDGGAILSGAQQPLPPGPELP